MTWWLWKLKSQFPASWLWKVPKAVGWWKILFLSRKPSIFCQSVLYIDFHHSSNWILQETANEINHDITAESDWLWIAELWLDKLKRIEHKGQATLTLQIISGSVPYFEIIWKYFISLRVGFSPKSIAKQRNYVIVIIFLPDGDAHVLVRANLHWHRFHNIVSACL